MVNRKFEAGWAKALQKYTHSKITFYGCKCKKKTHVRLSLVPQQD